MYTFEELDGTTREWMLDEWRREESSGAPYRSVRLSGQGLAAFPDLMQRALRDGDDDTLAAALSDPRFWISQEQYELKGVRRFRSVNPQKAAEFLARTEFLTWYVRGFARRLLEEGESACVVHRVAAAWEPRDECLVHEGQQYSVRSVYDGHRARYHPAPGNPTAFSIPVGTNCHHAIRRLRREERQ